MTEIRHIPLPGRLFLRTAVLTGLAGMVLGIVMGARHDFTLAPVHAHVNLLGWVSMFLFAAYYIIVPGADRRLALWQYGASLIGLVMMTIGIGGSVTGREALVPVAIFGSLFTVASMLIFTWIVFDTTRARPASPGETRPGDTVAVPQDAAHAL